MRCICRRILPKVAPKISESQFGGVPGKGTREAVLVATEIIARFHKATKGHGKAVILRCISRRCSSTWRRPSTR